MLEVDVEHRFGSFALAARFSSGPGVTALFGRSGSGKSTLVNIIAGLVRPDRGKVMLGDTVLFDRARGVHVPARRRRIGYVFQEGRLFPHLSVRQNLLYGRRFVPSADRYADFDHTVELLGIEHLLDRRPGSLSGGEKQRVAIGRALLVSPRLLLMDEPLASLDAPRKLEILPYIERLRDELRVPVVYVSHAVEEVIQLANTVVLLADGRMVDAGPVEAVMGRLDFGRLAGVEDTGAVFDATVAGQDERFGLTDLAFFGGRLRVPRLDLPIGATVRTVVRARDVAIALEPPTGLSVLNVLPGRILEVGATDGPFAEIRIGMGGSALIARVTRQAVHNLGLCRGREVYALIKSVALDRRRLATDTDGPDRPAAPSPSAF